MCFTSLMRDRVLLVFTRLKLKWVGWTGRQKQDIGFLLFGFELLHVTGLWFSQHRSYLVKVGSVDH
jgi:hypothetical protein